MRAKNSKFGLLCPPPSLPVTVIYNVAYDITDIKWVIEWMCYSCSHKLYNFYL